jgi:hypothetical protein
VHPTLSPSKLNPLCHLQREVWMSYSEPLYATSFNHSPGPWCCLSLGHLRNFQTELEECKRIPQWHHCYKLIFSWCCHTRVSSLRRHCGYEEVVSQVAARNYTKVMSRVKDLCTASTASIAAPSGAAVHLKSGCRLPSSMFYFILAHRVCSSRDSYTQE